MERKMIIAITALYRYDASVTESSDFSEENHVPDMNGGCTFGMAMEPRTGQGR
jgi:hypothetical protein